MGNAKRGIVGTPRAGGRRSCIGTIARMRSPTSLLTGPLAAIDMGSNSFRLEIGQLQHGRYRRIDYLKETVRLGAVLDAEGLLTVAAMQVGDDAFVGRQVAAEAVVLRVAYANALAVAAV